MQLLFKSNKHKLSIIVTANKRKEREKKKNILWSCDLPHRIVVLLGALAHLTDWSFRDLTKCSTAAVASRTSWVIQLLWWGCCRWLRQNIVHFMKATLAICNLPQKNCFQLSDLWISEQFSHRFTCKLDRTTASLSTNWNIEISDFKLLEIDCMSGVHQCRLPFCYVANNSDE